MPQDAAAARLLPYTIENNQSNDLSSLTLDKKKTTRNLFTLSLLTALPFLTLSFTRSAPEFRREIVISAALFSIPAAIGWPVFLIDFKKYKRGKLKPRSISKDS